MTDRLHEAQGRLIKTAHDLAELVQLDSDSDDLLELAWLIAFEEASAALGEVSAARREAQGRL